MGTDNTSKFVGSIPSVYEERLGPLLFEFYAADLARRVVVPSDGRVLETACGTGISTQFLRAALPDSVAITATDLNEAMLDIAHERRGDLTNVSFEQADALNLPLDDDAFDAVVCQFGVMFYPDKAAAVRETARVLKPGGQFIFNVWDSLDRNPIIQLGLDVLPQFFDGEPSRFLEVPFGFHALDPIRAMLHEAGFDAMDIHVIPTVRESPSARHVAEGLIGGNPTILDLQERGNAPVEKVIEVTTAAVAEAFGDNPVRVPLQAIVISARL